MIPDPPQFRFFEEFIFQFYATLCTSSIITARPTLAQGCTNCGLRATGPIFCGNCSARLPGPRSPNAKGLLARARYDERWAALTQHATKTNDARAKLVTEFLRFLEDLGAPPSLYHATPRDVVQFLMSRDARGLIIVHKASCPYWSFGAARTQRRCNCPGGAAASSVHTNIGLLRGAFRDVGITTRWSPATATGNPATAPEVKIFEDLSLREQAAGGVVTRRAPLMAVEVAYRVIDVAVAQGASAAARGNHAAAVSYARDAFMYSLLWYSGLRLKDLLRVLHQQLRFEATASNISAPTLMMRVTVTKTSHDPRTARVITILDDGSKYAPQGLYRAFMKAAARAGTPLLAGPLFRTFQKRKGVLGWWNRSSEQSTRARFANLLAIARLCGSITLHSFHASKPRHDLDHKVDIAVILKLLDWTRDTFDYYTKDRTVMSLVQALSLFIAPQKARKQAADVAVPAGHMPRRVAGSPEFKFASPMRVVATTPSRDVFGGTPRAPTPQSQRNSIAALSPLVVRALTFRSPRARASRFRFRG